MIERDIYQVLESTGLSKNEVLVYIDLIRAGKSSVIDISRRTRIHRSNTYDILEKLLKKGVVNQSIENEKKFFYPINPKDLLNYLKQKEEELKKIIPEIESIQNKPEEERKVTISEGLNSVKNILSHLLDSGEPIYMQGTPKDSLELLGGFLEEFHKTRVRKKIPLKRIHGIHAIKRVRELNKMEHTEAKFLPSYDSRICTNICGDKVIIILWDMPISVIVIENQAVADTYKHNFEILWDQAESSFE